MAEDNTEEAETNQSTLALDSNKQREFEDKVKRIRAEVTVSVTRTCINTYIDRVRSYCSIRKISS